MAEEVVALMEDILVAIMADILVVLTAKEAVDLVVEEEAVSNFSTINHNNTNL